MAPPKHKCLFCDKVLPSMSRLEFHMRSHTGEKPFFCKYCDKSFVLQDVLTRHTKTIHENSHEGLMKEGKKPFDCNTCGQSFARATNLREHIRNYHKEIPEGRRKFPCEICGIFFLHGSNLSRHRLKVHGHRVYPDNDKPLACPKCNKKFIHKHSVVRHLRRTHKELFEVQPNDLKNGDNDKNVHICEYCNKSFLKLSHLLNHKRQSHKDEHIKLYKGKLFNCPQCNETFSRRAYLSRHRRRVHNVQPSSLTNGDENKNVHTCKICNKSFLKLSHLINHKRQSHKVQKSEVNMEEFSKLTQTVHKRKPQIAKLPKKECAVLPDTAGSRNKFSCEICGKTFGYKDSLSRHRKRVHDGRQKPFSCEKCNMTFFEKFSMLKHVRTVHEGIRIKFFCEVCDMTFGDRRTMKKHMINIHQQLPKARHIHSKPGKCAYCGRRFFRHIKTLLRHQNNCQWKNDYKCGTCGEIFLRKNMYLQHVRSFCAKRDLFYKCLICNSWDGTDPLTILEHAIKCKPTGKPQKYLCNLCRHDFSRKTVAYHIQYELLHSSLFKEIPCCFKCESCRISFPNEALLRLHQELEHPCLLHMVGLQDLDDYKVQPDKKERVDVRDLDQKVLEFKGKTPKHRCHVCLYPFHSHKVRDLHAEICAERFGVTKIQHADAQPRLSRQEKEDYFDFASIDTRWKPLNYKLTPKFATKLYNTLIHDMKINRKFVASPDYCDITEGKRDLFIAKGMLRKWIPTILQDNPSAKAFFERTLFSEDIAVVEKMKKAPPELIDISDGHDIPAPPVRTVFKCISCFKQCANEDELLFHTDIAPKYFNKKENAKINCKKKKLQFNKKFQKVKIPKEPTDYIDLSLWMFKGKIPEYFCSNCGHPYHSRKVRDFHQDICDEVYFPTVPVQEPIEAPPRKIPDGPTLRLVTC